MIIEARSKEGMSTRVYLADGTLFTLPVVKYNTQTGETTVFEQDENGKIKMSDWLKDGDKMTRHPITKVVILEGSYAVIDGVKYV